MTQAQVEKKWGMNASIELVVFFALMVVAVVLLAPQGVCSDDPTSHYVSLGPIRLEICRRPRPMALRCRFKIWDAAIGGKLISTEPHTVDTDKAPNVNGFTDLLLGRNPLKPGGLDQ